jgi:crossover junction endodeoxyribonuclease RuvC
VRVLGIDPGSRFCGYGVIERADDSSVRYIECGVIDVGRSRSLEERLFEVGRGLREVIDELKPAEVAVEGVFYGMNARSALQLGQARGVALAVCGEFSLQVAEYAPATVKRAVAGRGQASKSQVSSAVRAWCHLQKAPRLDASDALAVALCHVFRRRNG